MFDALLNRTGAPRIAIADAATEAAGSDWDLYLLLAQGTPPYPLEVPVSVRTTTGEQSVRVPLAKSRDAATLTFHGKPLSVTVDPNFQLWRELAAAESPPILREAIAARDRVVVTLDSSRDFSNAAATVAGALLEHPARSVDALPADAPVAVVIGPTARIEAALARYRLGARPEQTQQRGTAWAWTVRRENEMVLVISARDPASLAALARTLPHLGSQSWAVFEGSRPVARGVWPAEAVSVPVRLTAGK
jgi:hypothetical protein